MANDVTQPKGIFSGGGDDKVFAADGSNAIATPLTNQSGAALETADVGVLDPDNASSVDVNTTAAALKAVAVVPQTLDNTLTAEQHDTSTKSIANTESGYFYLPGTHVPAVEVDAAWGEQEWLTLSSTADKLSPSGKIAGTDPPPVGTVGLALDTGGAAGNAEALIFMPYNGIAGLAYDDTAPSDGDAMLWSSGNSQWEAGPVQAYAAPYKTQANSAAEVTVFSTTISGGSMGANGLLIIDADFAMGNNKGTNGTCTIRLKHGSTTIASAAVTVNNAAAATSRALSWFHFVIRNTNSQSAQLISATLWSKNDPVALSATLGNSYDSDRHTINSAAEDTSGDLALTVTAQMSAAHADFQWELVNGRVETIKVA